MFSITYSTRSYRFTFGHNYTNTSRTTTLHLPHVILLLLHIPTKSLSPRPSGILAKPAALHASYGNIFVKPLIATTPPNQNASFHHLGNPPGHRRRRLSQPNFSSLAKLMHGLRLHGWLDGYYKDAIYHYDQYLCPSIGLIYNLLMSLPPCAATFFLAKMLIYVQRKVYPG
ncbi:hypothetical protein GMOD_00004241 [Pyrenophora seminiperda CCB06]|uniref:Uncharacterized protein n=1 Tax=Pyrenophora seminiperda CCB06 TaxID=1302712 RepID=A0A3M7M0W0_9PLEO|nr:hypothetical protein GMOD_00004241 [Pyrenophora seminiperda CCB06]